MHIHFDELNLKALTAIVIFAATASATDATIHLIVETWNRGPDTAIYDVGSEYTPDSLGYGYTAKRVDGGYIDTAGDSGGYIDTKGHQK